MRRSLLLLLATTVGFLLPTDKGADAQFANGVISAAPGFVSTAINVKSKGAVGNFCTFQGALMANGSPNITLSGTCPLTAANVGNRIVVTGAKGISSAPLSSTILSVTDSTHAVLADSATADTDNYYFTIPTDLINGGTSGNFVPGDILDCPNTGVVAGQICKLRVYSTNLRAINSITSAGTGSKGGTCRLKAVNGTMFGQPPIVKFSSTVGGGITGTGTFISQGYFFVNPSTTVALDFVDAGTDPTKCGVTGVQLNVSIGVGTAAVDTQGVYTAPLTNPVTFGAGSISGATGASFNTNWSQTGSGGFGIDDTVAISAAMTQAITANKAGKQIGVYFPSGNYLINGAALPLCDTNCLYYGDGVFKTALTAGPDYAGTDLLKFANNWFTKDIPLAGPSFNYNGSPVGSAVTNLSIIGFTGVTSPAGAITFYGRNDRVLIDTVDVWYMGNCMRAGILGLTGVAAQVSMIRESTFNNINCHATGTATNPAFQLTASAAPTFTSNGPNNNNVTNLNIYGSTGSGLVIDTDAAGGGGTIANGGSNKVVNVRVEGLRQSFGVGSGDLVRIGKSGETANLSRLKAVNVVIVGAVADVTTPVYYCGLRITGNKTNDISFRNLSFASGSGGSNALCIDAGYNLYFGVDKFASQIYDVTIASSATVGDNITVDTANSTDRYAPYFWNIDPTSLNSLYVPMMQSYTDVYPRTFPTGFPKFIASLTGDTAVTLPTSGTLATQATLPYAGPQIIGKLIGANFNTTADQAIPLTFSGSGWKPGVGRSAAAGFGGVMVTNCSKVPTAAAGTVYTAAAKGGIPFGLTTDNYTVLSAANVVAQNAGNGAGVTNIFTGNTVYLSLTTPEGSAMTCDVYIVATIFP